MKLVNLLLSILLSIFLLSNISYASDKTKWFAKECYRHTDIGLEATRKKVKLSNEYSYYNLTREPKYNFYQIKIQVDFIMPWGEKKQKIITCEFNDDGEWMGTAGLFD
ncbi:hypothetical protein N9Z35_06475 [Alphaproteobacteria bacterium]|nr:hypothetical protein [Alphaproteobacteria bacterium]